MKKARHPFTHARTRERGATMVSVMLLTVSLLTVAVLVVQSSQRELQQASALVARERATMAAQATIDLGMAHIRQATFLDDTFLTTSLTGYNPPGDPDLCEDAAQDCIPGTGTSHVTGQRNSALAPNRTDCAGRPCMRPGAIMRLPDRDLAPVFWTEVAMADLIEKGDSEAIVTLWVRNNASDVLGSGGSGQWTLDNDGTIVLTAMATVRNTTVAIEQEMRLSPGSPPATWNKLSADEGYGGGHNNDNSAVGTCAADALGYEAPPDP